MGDRKIYGFSGDEISDTSPYFGSPFHAAATNSGTIIVSTTTPTFVNPNYGILLRLTGVYTQTSGTHTGALILPVFPGIELPRRFDFQISFEISGTTPATYLDWHLMVGTPNGISKNFHGYSNPIAATPSYHGNGHLSVNSASVNYVVSQDPGTTGWWGPNASNNYYLTFEQKTTNPQTVNDIIFRTEFMYSNPNVSADAVRRVGTGSFTSPGWAGANLTQLYFCFTNNLAYGDHYIKIHSMNLLRHKLDRGNY